MRSEQLANNVVWSDAGGTPSITDGADTLGELNLSEMVTTSVGEGRFQDIGVLADNAGEWTFSCWVKTASGTADVQLNLGNTGRSSFSTVNVTATTEAQRIRVHHDFPASTGGNIIIAITNQESGGSTVYAGGFMAEDANDGGVNGNNTEYPSSYVQTGAAVATKNEDVLFYPSSNS